MGPVSHESKDAKDRTMTHKIIINGDQGLMQDLHEQVGSKDLREEMLTTWEARPSEAWRMASKLVEVSPMRSPHAHPRLSQKTS
jgi:hypothetical protein